MKRITVDNYRSDKYYARVVRAVDVILARKDFVAPIEVFVEMSLLTEQSIAEWRAGRVPYLERVIQCNLGAASRILRLLRMHAHDLNLRPSPTVYIRRTRGGRLRLRFTKTCDLKLEEAYASHFVKVVSKRKPKPVIASTEEADCSQLESFSGPAEHLQRTRRDGASLVSGVVPHWDRRPRLHRSYPTRILYPFGPLRRGLCRRDACEPSEEPA